MLYPGFPWGVELSDSRSSSTIMVELLGTLLSCSIIVSGMSTLGLSIVLQLLVLFALELMLEVLVWFGRDRLKKLSSLVMREVTDAR